MAYLWPFSLASLVAGELLRFLHGREELMIGILDSEEQGEGDEVDELDRL